jgi:hypothetical protein
MSKQNLNPPLGASDALEFIKNILEMRLTHKVGVKTSTSWSLLGPRVEVGLVPNIMKCIHIFTADVIKDFSYNYDKIIQALLKKGNKKKKPLLWKCLKWCHMALSDYILSPQAYLHYIKQIIKHYKAQFPNTKKIPVTLLLLTFKDDL